MIVNNKDLLSIIYKSELEKRTYIPVYQDRQWLNIWNTLEGAKDDFLIYDRCGLLNYHIRMPYAYIGYGIVETAIRATHAGFGICQNCTKSLPIITTDPPVTVTDVTTDVTGVTCVTDY